MTIDDENSIYVGGLPYSATEDSLRRVFGVYGFIVAVKIVNDRATRGKCYGFVTFRNPRSVIDAITDMDGKAIDGRVVKVNEVTTRGGRSDFGRQHFRRNMERTMNWERGREREREYEHNRGRHQERYRDRSRERDWSLDYDGDREGGYEHAHYDDYVREGFLDGDQNEDRGLADDKREQGRNSELNGDRNHALDSDGGRDMEGSNGVHKSLERDLDHLSRKQNGYNDRHAREMSSNSDDYYEDGMKERLERLIQKRDELEKEISQMEGKLEDKQRLVSDLQKKAMKLEDALVSAKRLSSHRKLQMTKLHQCFLQTKDYAERLKSSEQELQSLVNATMAETDVIDNAIMRDEILISGNL